MSHRVGLGDFHLERFAVPNPLWHVKTLCLLGFLSASSVLSSADAPLPVVPSIDVQRYAGTWFEIARLPNRFEKDCASDVTARYIPRSDGKLGVVNGCRKADGTMKSVEGTAKLRSKNGPNTQLRVTFFWPFYGDYWIIDLDPDYRWALVGTPSREYLWILSRTPKLNEGVMERIQVKAKSLGFKTGDLIRSKQAS